MTLKKFATLAAPALAVVLLATTAAPADAQKKKFRKQQKRPVKLGSSVGNANDFEIEPPFISCAGGTAGALLEMDDDEVEGGKRYFVLSNNHVFSMVNQGRPGDEIVQPGLLDSECESETEDAIALFSSHKRIKFGDRTRNRVDMALAEVIDGQVRTDGKILRIGVPGNRAVEAFPDQAVMKSGRTSGFTRGTVFTINTQVEVSFSSAGGAEESAVFRNQDIILSGRKDFSAGGDSGSVVYLDLKNTPGASSKKCPPAVGLLFAGSDAFTVMNPMSKVLKVAKRLKPRGVKTLVGCDSPLPALTATSAILGGPSAPEERGLRRASRISDRWAERVLELEGVVGIGAGLERPEGDPVGRAVVRVLVERADAETLAGIPAEIDGMPVRVVETGRFKAF